MSRCYSHFTISAVPVLHGIAPPSGMDFGAISRDFERKILRPRKLNFGVIHSELARLAAGIWDKFSMTLDDFEIRFLSNATRERQK